jgi:pimeloyl-ACP methyl ester carboxylesterase
LAGPGRAAESIGRSAEFLVETPERFLELPRPEPDKRLLDDPDVRDLFLKTILQAVQQGIDAYAWDGVLERRAWGFSLAGIAANVWIFHGEQDAAVPPSDAEQLAAALSGSHVKLVADAGHGLIITYWAEILSALNR